MSVITVDIGTPYACAAAAVLAFMSAGTIGVRWTWMIRDGEPVWRVDGKPMHPAEATP